MKDPENARESTVAGNVLSSDYRDSVRSRVKISIKTPVPDTTLLATTVPSASAFISLEPQAGPL